MKDSEIETVFSRTLNKSLFREPTFGAIKRYFTLEVFALK